MSKEENFIENLKEKIRIKNLMEKLKPRIPEPYKFKTLKEGGINISALVIDGVNLDKVSTEDVKVVADFAKVENIVVWFSDTNENEVLNETVSADKEPLFATVAHITQMKDGVNLCVLKADGNVLDAARVKLDSKTLLMTNK